MKFIVTTIVLAFVLVLKSSCDEYMGEFVDWYPSLESYKFYPKIGNCYEIYDSNQKVTPLICQKPVDPRRLSCIHLTVGKQYCLVLKTPTNELVHLLCEDSEELLLSYHLDEELNNCFNVSRFDKSYGKTCQQKFDNYSIGITTPDNFTVLFDSYFCSTSLGIEERKTYNTFINTFSFDPEARSCYKIYNESQGISPYTCLNKDVFSSCVEQLPSDGDCEGIITQNNETVLLNCRNDPQLVRNRCFKIYSADNSSHIACQEKVEERCVGIVTPSNLTVLLECYFCSKPGIKYTSYNVEKQRSHRNFIKTYLSQEHSGHNSYLGKIYFKTYKQDEHLEIVSTAYGYWLPNSTCYGITLKSNEIVILECISKTKLLRPGCFSLIDSNTNQEQTVCVRVLNETCVGLTTPLKWSVELGCYSEKQNLSSPNEILREKYIQDPPEKYRFYPGLNDCYEVYHSQEVSPYSCRKSAIPKNYSCINWIPGKTHCLGLTTPSNETIEFVCGDSPENVLTYNTFSTIKNCFNIYDSNNKSSIVCQQKFGNYSIGVTTPSNYSILFDSFFCPAYKSLEKLQEFKYFAGNFTFDPSIRSCYKVYRPDQDISPYTCLNDDVYDACIHILDNTNCMGIKTQNNETIVLECLNDISVTKQKGCFKIYTADYKEHTACQKQVEERCFGLVTPSNLTVLFECHTCLSTKGGSGLPIYTDEYRKSYRSFVEYYLYVFTQDSHALKNTTILSAYTPEQGIKLADCYDEIRDYDIHVLLGHGGCQGITLENLETIVLYCPNRIQERIGCYDVFSPLFGEVNKIIGPEYKVGNVCVKILNEWCVGITTPKNWTVPLSCVQLPIPTCPLATPSNSENILV